MFSLPAGMVLDLFDNYCSLLSSVAVLFPIEFAVMKIKNAGKLWNGHHGNDKPLSLTPRNLTTTYFWICSPSLQGINPLSLKSDQHQISPCNINAL